MIEVRLERVAHGGYTVGRHQGKVIFVTGGLPGELVRVEVTESLTRFDRGRVIEVIDPAAGRVIPPCPIAGECGGCDWQHVSLETQRELKAAVVAEQLLRLTDWEFTGDVEAVEPATRWRYSMRYAMTPDGRPGMRARRSHTVVPLPGQGCLIAADPLSVEELARYGSTATEVVVSSGVNGTAVVADGRHLSGPSLLHHTVLGRDFQTTPADFWQSHLHAPEVLTNAVLEGLAPKAKERSLDLYCGVGLFAGALVDAGCEVTGVEMSAAAIGQARRNVPQARFHVGDVGRLLHVLPDQVDTIVLDPPRKGARREVLEHLVGLKPRAMAYVACDPAALGRDLKILRDHGWEPTTLRAFDVFPMTHHVECVAIVTPAERRAH